MDPLRVIVVDDSALFRMLLRNVLSQIPHCEVVASVGDGQTAIESILRLQPDLVTLDVEMPGLSGIEVLHALKRQRCTSKILMVSRHTTAGAQVTTDALLEGAFDFILKPSGTDPLQNRQVLLGELQSRIAALTEVDAAIANPASTDRPVLSSGKIKAVVIGCSTGGPDALAQIIPHLPASLPVPVIIVQHMPEGFTRTLAARLNEASELNVVEAEDGLSIGPGKVVLARGGRHLRLSRDSSSNLRIHLDDAPAEHGCRPAVDYTLRTVVDVLGGEVLVLVLTGMGRDGTEGCRLVRQHNGHIIAQHRDSCVVYGMPKSD
jgi:two-component system, chemotaxis family, protein-glutamate methylesterase/glutaminase